MTERHVAIYRLAQDTCRSSALRYGVGPIASRPHIVLEGFADLEDAFAYPHGASTRANRQVSTLRTIRLCLRPIDRSIPLAKSTSVESCITGSTTERDGHCVYEHGKRPSWDVRGKAPSDATLSLADLALSLEVGHWSRPQRIRRRSARVGPSPAGSGRRPAGRRRPAVSCQRTGPGRPHRRRDPGESRARRSRSHTAAGRAVASRR